MFGITILGDDEHVYDHDFWGNVSYGYTMSAAGFDPLEIRLGASIDDLKQYVKDFDFTHLPDLRDDPMVRIGIDLYNKYGDKMTIDDLRREIIARKDDLRRYKKEELTDRRYRTKGGEDVDGIAGQYNLTADQLVEYNMLHEQGVKGLSKEQSFLPGVKPILPDPVEMSWMQQSEIPGSLLKSTMDNYRKIMSAVSEHGDERDEVLFKGKGEITEEELKENERYAWFDVKDEEKKRMLNEKGKEGFDYYYGIDPVKYDETGKMMEATLKHEFPKEKVAAKTKDNVLMSDALKNVAEIAAGLGIKSLQKGLNALNDRDYGKQALKEDGDLGPKTVFRMKEALSTKGVGDVGNSVRLGGFADMLEGNRKREVDQQSLSEKMTAIRPKDGGLFLQKGLNQLGAGLKEDNYIGPKTTLVFNQVKDEHENALNKFAEENMAKEIEKTKAMEERERKKEEERVEREKQKEQERQELEREKKRLQEIEEEEPQGFGMIA